MRFTARLIPMLLGSLVLATTVDAGLPPRYRQTKDTPSGSIAGKVTLDGQAAIGVKVSLGIKPDPNAPGRLEGSTRWTTTDAEGRYIFDALAPASYEIIPRAPALIPDGDPYSNPRGNSSSIVTLRAGEAVDGIDFSLIRGGVITGKITDSKGMPLIRQSVTAVRINTDGSRTPSRSRHSGAATDDRGIYRMYGVEPGRYRLYCFVANWGQGSHLTPLTYFPGTPDEARASLVTVEAGGETRGIDFQISSMVKKGYRVSGTIIDAETGQAIPHFSFSYVMRGQDGSIGSVDSDEAGFFHLDRLEPGNYSFFGRGEAQELVENQGYYLNVIPFDVVDGPVSGLEVRAQRGSSIDGLLTIDGPPDAAANQNLGRLVLVANSDADGVGRIESGPAPVAPDGGFHLAGVAPGMTHITLRGTNESSAFKIMKVTRDDVDQTEGFHIDAGEQITGIRVNVRFDRGTIHGQVKVKGPRLEMSTQMYVMALNVADRSVYKSVLADAHGVFTLGSLPDGDYALSVRVGSKPLQRQEQIVTIQDGADVEVTLVWDSAKVSPPRPN